MPPQVSLRARLLRQFLLLGLWPIPLLLLAAVVGVAPLLERQALERQRELAAAIEEQVLQRLQKREATLGLLAAQWRGGVLTVDGMARALPALVSNDSFLQAVYLVNGRGQVTHAALPTDSGRHAEDLIGVDVSLREQLDRRAGGREPSWSDAFLSTLTGRITAVLSVPAAGGSLVGELSLEGLSQSIAEIAADSALRAVVLDRHGRVIADADVQRALRQENLSNLLVVQQAMRGESANDRVEFAGREQLMHALPVRSIGWTVLTLQPVATVFEPVRRLAYLMLALLLAAVPLASAAAWLVARRTGREVKSLADGVQAVVDRGVEPPRLAFTTREFDAVWRRLAELVDELHRRDAQTEAANRELQAVLDAATEVAIIATDARGTVTVFNVGAQRMLGLAAAEQIGRTTPLAWHDPEEVRQRVQLASAKHGIELSPFDALVVEARHGGYEVRDWTFVRADGRRIEVSLAITAVRDAAGHLKGFLGVAIDITERRRAAELELSRRSAELASEAKSEFLSRVSHELRSPLNAMLGFAQLLEADSREPPTPGQRERLRHIQQAGWHLVRLIDDVLDLSRIESGHLRVGLETVAVGPVVQQALDLVGGDARQQGVALRPPQGRALAAAVVADRTRLTQVLVNLLSNAIKYNRPGGGVDIDLQTIGDRLALVVHDTGRGMSEEQLRRLFRPFDRLGLEGSGIHGTGIGLVITQRLVEAMQGTLAVHSEVGVGTTFTVMLPLAEAEAEAAGEHTPAPVAPAAVEEAGSPPAPGACVVYVEDNDMNAKLMRAVFRQRPAIELRVAGSIGEALATLRERGADLVLLDMHLPDGNGSDMLAAMAADTDLRELPVVAVSADATRAQVQAAMGGGIRAYITKPIDVPQLLATVDQILADARVR